MEFLNGENVSVALFFIGLAGIFSSRRILKSIVCIGIMEVAAITFFLTMFATTEQAPPINVTAAEVADPLPQALMITAIVIGVAVTAISLCMFITLYHLYGNSDWTAIHKKRMDNFQ